MHENHRPDIKWPEKGAIEFQGYSTRYRDGLDLVLRELQCRISPGERVSSPTLAAQNYQERAKLYTLYIMTRMNSAISKIVILIHV